MADKAQEQHSCIRCGQMASKKEEYCTYCGAPFSNRCTYDGGPIGEPCTKVNRPDAAFCSACGAQTTFAREGIIPTRYPPRDQVRMHEWDEINQFNHPFFGK
jgi:RNA polymerase subunit RPABC4/transcription elongation factor Spt4